MKHIYQEFEKHHGSKEWDDSSTLRADEADICFEFQGVLAAKDGRCSMVADLRAAAQLEGRRGSLER